LEKFKNNGFETFKTTLGGKGVGLLADPDEDILKYMTVRSFIDFEDTNEIENSVGCGSVDSWRYW
jgi:mevalonate kinase